MFFTILWDFEPECDLTTFLHRPTMVLTVFRSPPPNGATTTTETR